MCTRISPFHILKRNPTLRQALGHDDIYKLVTWVLWLFRTWGELDSTHRKRRIESLTKKLCHITWIGQFSKFCKKVFHTCGTLIKLISYFKPWDTQILLTSFPIHCRGLSIVLLNLELNSIQFQCKISWLYEKPVGYLLSQKVSLSVFAP